MAIYAYRQRFCNSIYYEGTKKNVVAYLRATKPGFILCELSEVRPKKVDTETAVKEKKKAVSRRQRELKKSIAQNEEEASALSEEMAILEKGRLPTPKKRKKKP
jgi:hypothetical protein